MVGMITIRLGVAGSRSARRDCAVSGPGIPLLEVIRESTTNPASEIGHPELGQIAVGSIADIAVLRVEHGNFGYADLAGGKVDGSERILAEMTIRAGHIVFDLNARTAVPWRAGHLKYATR